MRFIEVLPAFQKALQIYKKLPIFALYIFRERANSAKVPSLCSKLLVFVVIVLVIFVFSPVRDNILVNDRWAFGTMCKHGDVKNCQDGYDPCKYPVKLEFV